MPIHPDRLKHLQPRRSPVRRHLHHPGRLIHAHIAASVRHILHKCQLARLIGRIIEPAPSYFSADGRALERAQCRCGLHLPAQVRNLLGPVQLPIAGDKPGIGRGKPRLSNLPGSRVERDDTGIVGQSRLHRINLPFEGNQTGIGHIEALVLRKLAVRLERSARSRVFLPILLHFPGEPVKARSKGVVEELAVRAKSHTCHSKISYLIIVRGIVFLRAETPSVEVSQVAIFEAHPEILQEVGAAASSR